MPTLRTIVFHIRADAMGSFRNRLLVLIIGLVVVTQSVTLIAVLARVESTVEGRAAGELNAGGAFLEQMIRFRASQLASGVGVLAADFGFREAMATGDATNPAFGGEQSSAPHRRRSDAAAGPSRATCSPPRVQWISDTRAASA